jgi:hypothetical protein
MPLSHITVYGYDVNLLRENINTVKNGGIDIDKTKYVFMNMA